MRARAPTAHAPRPLTRAPSLMIALKRQHLAYDATPPCICIPHKIAPTQTPAAYTGLYPCPDASLFTFKLAAIWPLALAVPLLNTTPPLLGSPSAPTPGVLGPGARRDQAVCAHPPTPAPPRPASAPPTWYPPRPPQPANLRAPLAPPAPAALCSSSPSRFPFLTLHYVLGDFV
ncbi:hypothetical protein DFH08DRAFT_971871 [Mycena albidolilacea]|uniref:Uncharacterized protein n=1 Tax=Mycena albidolilacea TaxID=1033008 RepID=A0AAD6ZCW8_9AGAR|nr:hypothetical protein DFH08DRAFT_971871 [Mycena albidolilacea]